jgi:DNA-binding transcriptional MerR regulator
VRAIEPGGQAATEPGWVTVRRAEAITGVPASTVRNWARKGRINSRMDDTGDVPKRLVPIHEVEERAQRLGRLQPQATERKAVAHEEPDAAREEPLAEPQPPEGHLLVPLDSWERLLVQLGNLHEAGQQLAEARERAAKAETESSFLRERLSEIRTERDQLIDRIDTATTDEEPPPEPVPHKPAQLPGVSLLERLYREFRRLTSR